MDDQNDVLLEPTEVAKSVPVSDSIGSIKAPTSLLSNIQLEIPPSNSPNSGILIVDDDDDDSSDSECEIVSVSSTDAESKWRNVKGPIARMNALMNAGFDNPHLLLTRLFGMDESILPTSVSSLWSIVYAILSEPVQRHRLRQYSTLDSVVNLLSSATKILVLTGAGISVSCGIPDFRSRDGVYARLSKDFSDLSSPQAMFEMDFFQHNPYPFFKFAKEIFPGQFKPSLAHRFIYALENKGKLLRNYTQNIDTLEQVAGIKKVIQCHGSFATASCTTCHYRVPGEEIRGAIISQTVPRCPKCCPESSPVVPVVLPDAANGDGVEKTKSNSFSSPVASTSSAGEDVPSVVTSAEAVPVKPSRALRSRGSLKGANYASGGLIHGVMKPDIVFFGEGLPFEFHSSLQEDIKVADLVLVMGSSLKVRPVSHIPNSIRADIPQILINRESLPSHTFDTQILGDCDEILGELAHRLGWKLGVEDTSEKTEGHLKEVELRVPLAAAVAARLPVNHSLSPLPTVDQILPSSADAIGEFPAENDTVNAAVEDPGPNGDVKIVEAIESAIVEPMVESTVKGEKAMTSSKDVVDKELKGDVKKQGTASSPIDVDKCTDDCCSSDATFNLAEFLPEGTFTRILPNQYVFKGAEVLSDYGMAEDCLRHEGDLFGEGYSSTSSDSSVSSSSASEVGENPTLKSTVSANEREDLVEDRFIRRLLRQCRADSELQQYLASKKSGALDTTAITSNEVQSNEEGEEDDCVIVSFNSKDKRSLGSPKVKRRKCDAKKSSLSPPSKPIDDEEQKAIAIQSTKIAVQHL